MRMTGIASYVEERSNDLAGESEQSSDGGGAPPIIKVLLFLFCIFMASFAQAAARIVEVEGTHGQKAWLMEDHSLPIVTVKIEFENSGTAYDEKGKEGLSTFAMQMLTEGAGDMDSLAFNRALEAHAVRLSADADEDSAAVSLRTLSEYKDDAFPLLALVLNKPRFDEDAVERARAGLTSELKEMQENPIYAASLAWKKLAFVGHPYQKPRFGTLESLALIKREDLRKYAGTVLACNRKIISVIGDISADETKKLLSAILPESNCTLPATTIVNVKPADGKEPVIMKEAVPQTVIQASLPAVGRNDPQYYAMVALNDIFGGGVFSSRLGEEIRNKRGLAYYAESDIEEFDHAAYISVHSATRNDQAKATVGIFMQEVEKIRDKGVSQAELDAAKRYITGSFPLELDSQATLAEYLTQMQRYHLGMDYLERRNALINAVTLSEVNQLAKTLFSHTPIIVMAGAPEEEKHK